MMSRVHGWILRRHEMRYEKCGKAIYGLEQATLVGICPGPDPVRLTLRDIDFQGILGGREETPRRTPGVA
jgi:hypothetical protein